MKTFAITAVTTGVLALSAFQASAYERWINLVNNSEQTIVSVQITNVQDEYFHGPNLLGNQVVRPGQTMQIEPVRHDGYCRFDIQLAYRNGEHQDIYNVNLCEREWLVTFGNGTRPVLA